MEIILASASPRRKEILKSFGFNFKVIPSNYNENILNKNYNKKLIENCAYQKALDVYNKEHLLTVSADTVVVLDNKILGKPKDNSEAFSMLKSLSDKTHFVQTSICIINDNKTLVDSEITFVTFKKLTDSEILDYIKNYNPLDKAGSYGIQDNNFDFAVKIEGNLDNVIGFPMNLFKKMLKNI